MNEKDFTTQLADFVKDEYLLSHIFYFGCHTKRGLFAKKIQKWYRKYNNKYPSEKSMYIRLKLLDYTNEMWNEYPTFSIQKINHITPYTGNGKKSDIIKWMIKNLDKKTIAAIGH